MKDKKSNCGSNAPYAGSGKLTDYKKDGSWMMNQIEKGYDKVERGITVKKDNDNIRFAKVAAKIASEDFKIVKNFKQLESVDKEGYRFALKWSIFSELNGSTLKDLTIVQELLQNKVITDYEKMIAALNAETNYVGTPVLDFNNNAIKMESIVTYKVDVKNTLEKIIEFLKQIGFEE